MLASAKKPNPETEQARLSQRVWGLGQSLRVAVVRSSGREDHSQLSQVGGLWDSGLCSSLLRGSLSARGPGPPLPTIWCARGCRPCLRPRTLPAQPLGPCSDTLPTAFFPPRTQSRRLLLLPLLTKAGSGHLLAMTPTAGFPVCVCGPVLAAGSGPGAEDPHPAPACAGAWALPSRRGRGHACLVPAALAQGLTRAPLRWSTEDLSPVPELSCPG